MTRATILQGRARPSRQRLQTAVRTGAGRDKSGDMNSVLSRGRVGTEATGDGVGGRGRDRHRVRTRIARLRVVLEPE